MREECAYRQGNSGIAPHGSDVESLGATREANRTARSTALAQDKLILLVRHAMRCLESDRKAALRCLNDVSALLGSHGQDPGSSPLEVLSGFRPGGLARWQARRALAYIEENLGSKIATHELAGVVSFSKSHFSRVFKRSLGLSPMAYVNKRRVDRAKAMMISTDRQLTEIALVCGFADQSHLNRTFRRMVGTSPGSWRRASTEVDGGIGAAGAQATSI